MCCPERMWQYYLVVMYFMFALFCRGVWDVNLYDEARTFIVHDAVHMPWPQWCHMSFHTCEQWPDSQSALFRPYRMSVGISTYLL